MKHVSKILTALACFSLASCTSNLVLRVDQKIMLASVPHIQQMGSADPYRANIELVLDVPGGDGLVAAEFSGKQPVDYSLQLPAKAMLTESFAVARDRWVIADSSKPPIKMLTKLRFVKFREAPQENSTRVLVMVGLDVQWLDEKGKVFFERFYEPGEQRSPSIPKDVADAAKLQEEYNKATYKAFILACEFALREIRLNFPVQ